MMSVVVEWDEHAAEYPSTSASYWCLKTMGPVGPDDGPAALDDCRTGRRCFEPQPQREQEEAELFVSGVLLAAGASSRFGSPKMLAPVGEDKEPLLRKVLETWLASGLDEVIVVLGNDADGIREKIGDFSYAAAADAAADSRKSVGPSPVVKGALRAPLRGEGPLTTGLRPQTPVFVENSRWHEGMFSSVKAGLAATDPRSTHVALSPADLPFLSKETLRTVLAAAASLAANGSSLVVPTHAGRRGHPLLIPAALRARIMSWPDSARLNQLFEEPDVTVHHLEGFDETILRDVDTPNDLLASRPSPFHF